MTFVTSGNKPRVEVESISIAIYRHMSRRNMMLTVEAISFCSTSDWLGAYEWVSAYRCLDVVTTNNNFIYLPRDLR